MLGYSTSMAITEEESLRKVSLNGKAAAPYKASQADSLVYVPLQTEGIALSQSPERSVWTLKPPFYLFSSLHGTETRAICKRGTQFCDSNLKWRKVGGASSRHSPLCSQRWTARLWAFVVWELGAEKGLGTGWPEELRSCNFWEVFWRVLGKVD